MSHSCTNSCWVNLACYLFGQYQVTYFITSISLLYSIFSFFWLGWLQITLKNRFRGADVSFWHRGVLPLYSSSAEWNKKLAFCLAIFPPCSCSSGLIAPVLAQTYSWLAGPLSPIHSFNCCVAANVASWGEKKCVKMQAAVDERSQF